MTVNGRLGKEFFLFSMAHIQWASGRDKKSRLVRDFFLIDCKKMKCIVQYCVLPEIS